MKFMHRQFDDMSPLLLKTLSGLTNRSKGCGDLRDDGTSPRSQFQSLIDDRLSGASIADVSVVLAHDGTRYAGWGTLTHNSTGVSRVNPAPEGPTGAVGFYVHPDYRRLGLGQQLLKEIVVDARKSGIRTLFANPWNRASDAFFQANGFNQVRQYVTGMFSGVSTLDVSAIR